MPYRAQVGGIFGSGVNPPRQSGLNIDVAPVAGIIAQALAAKRDGLIHKAMMQREFDRQDRLDAQAEAHWQQQQQAQAEERDYTRQRNDRLDQLAEAKQANETARYRAENGIVPDQYAPAPGTDLVGSFQPPSIRQAYQSGGGVVGQFQRPAAPVPSVGTVPGMQLVPGYTDPTLGTKEQDRQKTVADARQTHQVNRLFDVAHPMASEATGGVNPLTKFQADQKNKILDDYARDAKTFQQVMGGWEVLKGATKEPSLATPFAVTDAYARITNPGAIVRPTTLEMIHDMGSVGQRMQKYWAQHADGSLPPDILADFQRTLKGIMLEHKKQFDQVRQKAILRAKQSGITDIEPILENYTLDDAPQASAAPPVDLIKHYGLEP